MKKKVVIIGGGGHAKTVISTLKKLPEFEIVGYTDPRQKNSILGIQHLGDDIILHKLYSDKLANFASFGIGKVKLDDIRPQIYTEAKTIGFEFPPIISPAAKINDEVLIGDGTFIADDVVINPCAKIGKLVILNTACIIEHDSNIGDFTHVAPSAVICGNVKIGDNCFIGANSTIIQGLKIVSNCIIGAGSVVVKDCDTPGTYVGNPARKINSL